ncbi:MAG: condensation domain-containing protein, partial [Pyrinomonadaceae bacterium]
MDRLETTLLSEHLERERDYWLQKLSGELALTGLALDFERPPHFDERQERLEITISPQTQDKLFRASDRTPSLIFVILVAALKVCLYKYSGEEDIVVGSAIHERHSEDAALNKILPLRDRVSGAATVRQLLADVKQTLSEAYAHQKYPFERLLELLGFSPAVNQEPLFNVVILLENIHDAEKMRPLKNDLTFSFSMGDAGLAGTVEYRSSLFNRSTVEQFTRHYAQVLWSMLAQPDTQISKLNMLSEVETEKLLREWNETGSGYPRAATVAGLFEEQVKKRAAAVAVVSGMEQVSYG